MIFKTIIGLMFFLSITSGALSATEYNMLVAAKGTGAYKSAKAMAKGNSTIFVVGLRPGKGMAKVSKKAYKILSDSKKCQVYKKIRNPRIKWRVKNEKTCTLNIKIAHGNYGGGIGVSVGLWPTTTLRILGGYNDSFKVRAPFKTPTIIRGGSTIVKIATGGKYNYLKELYISGLFMDIAGGNKYDAKTNSLKKGESGSLPIISVQARGYLTTDRLVYADNVFINAPNKAIAPLIRAMSKNTEVIIRNNFFINNVIALLADTANYHIYPKWYKIVGNSFIMNWPYNPDATTSLAASVEIANKRRIKKYIIKDNLFAHNMGGALFDNGPSLHKDTTIHHNLFFNNGGLFGEKKPGAAAMVVKFGGFKNKDVPWNIKSVEDLEEEYEDEDKADQKVRGNSSVDPKIKIALVKPGFGNSGTISAKNTKMNDIRGILGMNKKGGKMKISNYAPFSYADAKTLPWPTNKAAKAFGVNPSRVEQFN